MLRSLIILWGMCFTLSASPTEGGLEFFVSPRGNDEHPGTFGQPFQSLGRAKMAVADVLLRATGDDIRVTFAGGLYPFEESVCFGFDDSPRDGSRVIYRAAEGVEAVFSGGKIVSGWRQHSEKIWKAPLKRDRKLRALYVDGERAVMARSLGGFGSSGPWGTFKIKAGQADWAWRDGEAFDGLRFSQQIFPKLKKNIGDIELVYRTTWNENFVGVREVTTEEEDFIVKLQQPYGAIAQNMDWNTGLRSQRFFTIQNAFELLDYPGEFYFDREEQMVYYFPRPGEILDEIKVIAPFTETLMELKGDSPERPVSNLVFEGFTFAHTDYSLADVAGSRGKVTIQTATVCHAFANPNWHLDLYRSYDTLPGAVIGNQVNGVEFTKNTFTHTGAEGLVLSNGIEDVRIIGNVFFDTGGSAVVLGHPHHVYENDSLEIKHPDGADSTKEKFKKGKEAAPRKVLVANNFLLENAVLFHGHSVVTVFFGKEIKLEHNWILKAPYSGISLGWGWCDFDGEKKTGRVNNVKGARSSVLPGKPSHSARENQVCRNRIEETMTELNDGGAIYTLGSMPGSVIEKNYIRDTQIGIYPDEGSSDIESSENVIEEPYKFAYFAIDMGRRHDLPADRYYLTKMAWKDQAPRAQFSNPQLCKANNWPQEAKAIISESGLEPAWEFLVKDWQFKNFPRRNNLRVHAIAEAVELALANDGKYEAERAELLLGCEISSKHSGYSGEGFVKGFYKKPAATVRFTVAVPAAGLWKLTIRYSSALGPSEGVGLSVNGEVREILDFTETARWNQWRNLEIQVDLRKGQNTISLNSINGEVVVFNVDYIRISDVAEG